jgi:hypothetical protein
MEREKEGKMEREKNVSKPESPNGREKGIERYATHTCAYSKAHNY